MSEKYNDANLIIKLYELRREETMRKARNWFIMDFNPSTIEDITKVLYGEHSAYYRMVISYWEMAASFVMNGAVDEKMFNDANAEHTAVLAKIEPLLGEIRSTFNSPKFLSNLEQLVMRAPDAKENMAKIRERIQGFQKVRESAAGKSA